MAIKGCGASLKLGTNAVAGLSSISNNLTKDPLDVTTFDSSCVREFIMGLTSGTIDISGFYEPGDTNGQVALGTAFLNGTKLETTQKPVFSVDGTNGFTADAYVNTYNVEAAVDGTVNFNATLQLTGTIAVV